MKENPGQFKRNQEIRTLIVSKDYKELSKYLSKNFEKLSIKERKLLAQTYFYLREYKSAENIYTKICGEDENSDCYYELGKSQYYQDDMKNALKSFEIAKNKKNIIADAWINFIRTTSL